jgi:hypothetical protein
MPDASPHPLCQCGHDALAHLDFVATADCTRCDCPAFVLAVECGDCDGCGWTEGGVALKTPCDTCKGSGVAPPASDAPAPPPMVLMCGPFGEPCGFPDKCDGASCFRASHDTPAAEPREMCNACQGRGYVHNPLREVCQFCEGNGSFAASPAQEATPPRETVKLDFDRAAMRERILSDPDVDTEAGVLLPVIEGGAGIDALICAECGAPLGEHFDMKGQRGLGAWCTTDPASLRHFRRAAPTPEATAPEPLSEAERKDIQRIANIDGDWSHGAAEKFLRRYEATVAALTAERDAARNALADMVVKATDYGKQDGDFVYAYIIPTGPMHRAIPLLENAGIAVRPGFDGRAPRGDFAP